MQLINQNIRHFRMIYIRNLQIMFELKYLNLEMHYL